MAGDYEAQVARLTQTVLRVLEEPLGLPESVESLVEVLEGLHGLAQDDQSREPGWHLVGIDRVIGKLALTTQSVLDDLGPGQSQEVPPELAGRLSLGFIRMGFDLVAHLGELGWRTSNWVETYKAFHKVRNTFGWVIDLEDTARQEACNYIAELDGDEASTLADFYGRAFELGTRMTC